MRPFRSRSLKLNALKHDLSPFDAIDDLVARYGIFAILRALVAHRIGRRRRRDWVRPVDIPPFLARDIGLAEPWPIRDHAMDVVNYR